VLVGGLDAVRDLGPGGLDVVGILDADRMQRRPGIGARGRAVAAWFEAAAWAWPHGRVIVQTTTAADPAVQALVRGNPLRFNEDESRRRADAGFPLGSAVFRVAGIARLSEEDLTPFHPTTLLSTRSDGGTTLLVSLDPSRVHEFGRAMRELASTGVVERVEAEPHL
jgi:hypothetical protein